MVFAALHTVCLLEREHCLLLREDWQILPPLHGMLLPDTAYLLSTLKCEAERGGEG